VKVEWVHFPLHPDTAGGRPRAGRPVRGGNVDRKAMHAQMKARMDAEGLPYGERTMTYNSRLPRSWQVGGHATGGEALPRHAVSRLLRGGARHLAARGTPGDRGQVGLSTAGAREVLEKRTFKAACRRRLGALTPVRGHRVPTFVVGRQGVVGAQPYEALEALVGKAGTQTIRRIGHCFRPRASIIST